MPDVEPALHGRSFLILGYGSQELGCGRVPAFIEEGVARRLRAEGARVLDIQASAGFNRGPISEMYNREGHVSGYFWARFGYVPLSKHLGSGWLTSKTKWIN